MFDHWSGSYVQIYTQQRLYVFFSQVITGLYVGGVMGE